MKKRIFTGGLIAVGVLAALVPGCGGDDSTSTPEDGGNMDVTVTDTGLADVGADTRGMEHTGQTCMVAGDCYPNVDAGSLKGAVTCLTSVTDGYCTHECTTNGDCCAVSGECATALREVCASFQSSAKKYCFLSCEAADLPGADGGLDGGLDGGPIDPNVYCQTQASADFTCRSTGGGVANQKACLPSGAPSDAATDAPQDAPDAG